MDGPAEVGAADRPGGGRRMGRWRALAFAAFLLLLVICFVLSIFVLDVVVADTVTLAMAVVWLAAAAWRAHSRDGGHAPMWFAAIFSVMMPLQLLDDIATEHRWPAGQMHELLIARRIGEVPAVACLAMVWITLLRKKAAHGDGEACSEPTAI